MGKINAEWHRANPMPPHPTPEQRYRWHQEHARACACRPIPPKLAEAMRALGFAVPAAPAIATTRARVKSK